mgnify:CR=1 FL=1
MRSQIIILIITSLLLMACDQSPTTLDEEPYVEGPVSSELVAEITTFKFDYLSREVFFAVSSSAPESEPEVYAELRTGDSLVAEIVLNDAGLGDDIQTNDHSFDGNWTLPDSLETYIDSLWILSIQAASNGDTLVKSQSLQPQRPMPPILSDLTHLDTLQLLAGGDLTLDTLSIRVSHPQGLDEVRDVSMFSQKPDSSWANDSLAIPLHDDGSDKVIFSYQGIDYTSGDSLAGDGIYSMPLGLTQWNLAGTYKWEFKARTWLGMESEVIIDSLVVLPVPDAIMKSSTTSSPMSGVFQ